MSVDIPAGDTVDRRADFTCAVCRGVAGDGGGFLATYPSEDAVALAAAEGDGLLPLCANCTGEVAELTDAWTELERPPVSDVPSIGEGYASTASACSFCENTVGDEQVLGVDSWTRAADAPEAACQEHDNYALCSGCVTVFDEFLRGIAPE